MVILDSVSGPINIQVNQVIDLQGSLFYFLQNQYVQLYIMVSVTRFLLPYTHYLFIQLGLSPKKSVDTKLEKDTGCVAQL